MKPIFYAYLIIIVVLSGCSSGKSTFEHGNYYEAVITSVNRLRRNSDHKKSVETLRQAYPLAVTFYEDRAKTSLASAAQFKWSEVVKSYTYINTMYDEIKRCPGALAVIPNPVNYFSKLQEARQNAAEENYAAGILALQGNTRDQAKKAYGYFKVANEFAPGYKEVNDYLKAALDAATVKIVVEPIPVHSRAVGVSAEFFNDKISEFVHSAAISEFVKFYSRAEAQKLKMNPDHIIQLSFDEFTVGEIYRHEREIQLSKDSVVLGTYVSQSTAPQNPNTNVTNTSPVTRTGLTARGTGVVASTDQTQSGTTQDLAEKRRLEQEQAAREAEEKRKLAQEQAAKALEDQRRAEQERAALEAKRRIEQEQAAKAQADRVKAEQEAAERERLAKAAEAERAAKEAEAQRAAKEAADKAQAERERLERERIEKERLEKERIEKERLEKEAAEKLKAEKEKAEKEKAEKEKAEKAKADKEKADKEKAEKEKAEKAKVADPTIKAEDTLNVTDPVVICHIPPGNPANSRTLKINRSALKAHLAHGDMEGDCNADKKDQNRKPDNDNKSNGKDPKEKPPGEKKGGKGPGGAASLEPSYNRSLVFDTNQLMIASNDHTPGAFFRYFNSVGMSADTNKVYGTVKATLYHHTKTTTSKGVVSFKIIDAKTGALLAVEKMPGEFVWKSEWATFNGDERALSAEQLTLTKQKELPAPAPQDLFIEFTRPIYDQITVKIKEFYKGY